MPVEGPEGVELRELDGVAVGAMIEELADVYVDARTEPTFAKDPLWKRESFVSRTRLQVGHEGFSLVAAYAEGTLVGFSFGFPIGPGRWFQGDTEPPQEILNATKFAIIELDVRRAWQARGIASALFHRLLEGRPEEYGMLGSLPGTRMRAVYERWGWRKVAEAAPGSGLPEIDTLVVVFPA